MANMRKSPPAKRNPVSSKGWVLFADAYGFKGMLGDAHLQTAADSLLKYQQALRLNLQTKQSDQSHSGLNFKLFSDLIALHFPCERECSTSFRIVTDIVSTICETAAKHKFLLRGALTYGDAIIGQDFILGHAYLRAYLIERDDIEKPIIVVPHSDLEAAGILGYHANQIETIELKGNRCMDGLSLDYVPFDQKAQIASFHITNLKATSPASKALETWQSVWSEANRGR
jgi:hypothetical protein